MPVHSVVDRIPTPKHVSLGQFVEMGSLLREGVTFVDTADGLQERDDRREDHYDTQTRFIEYMITGIHPDDKTQSFINLDPYRGEDKYAEYDVYQDFDSFIGISSTLPYASALSIRVCPSPQETLTQGVHLLYPVQFRDDPPRRVQLTKIPNFGFGSCHARHVVRLFLPALYNETTVEYSEGVAKGVYDLCTLPTLQEMMSERAAHFPSSFEAELHRARRRRGQLVRSIFDIPESRLARFTTVFLRHLSMQTFGIGAFFMHEIRGVKNRDHHPVREDIQINEVLDRAGDIFDIDEVQEQIEDGRLEIWVDVGFEAGITSHVALIHRDSHQRIVSHFTGLDQPAAQRKIEQVSNYHVDQTAMLTNAAGFRLGLKPNDVQPVLYLNCYVTEKEPTFLKDAGHFAKFINPVDILEARNNDLTTQAEMESIRLLFNEAMNIRYFPARFEARVPLQMVSKLTMNAVLAGQWTYVIPCDIWWGFKLLRQEALCMLTDRILMSPRSFVIRPETLTFIGVIAYITNALCARPDEHAQFESLRWAVLRHVNEDQRELAICPFGLFFVRGIGYYDTCPYLAHGRVLFKVDIAKIFGKKTFDDVVNIVRIRNMIEPPRAQPHPEARHNKQVRTEGFEYDSSAMPMLRVENEGIILPAPPGASAVDPDLAIEGYDMNSSSSDHIASKLWATLFANMGQKFWVPQDKTATPYVKMPGHPVKEVFFKEVHLTNCFYVVGFKPSTSSCWNTCFSNMFPDGLTKIPDRRASQNMYQMQFYSDYLMIREMLMSNVPEGVEMLSKFRKFLKKRFDDLVWVPYTEPSRMFTSSTGKRGKGEKHVYPRTHTGPAPVIVVNPKFNDQVQNILDRMETTDDNDWVVISD